MVKHLGDSNLLPHSKSNHNLKVMEFEIFRNSEYFSNFQIFKSPLTHANGV
jgi:hypothetical protein